MTALTINCLLFMITKYYFLEGILFDILTIAWVKIMYFLASRNARCFSAFHTDVLAFVA